MIRIYEPFLDTYKKSAEDAINTGWISNHGIYIEKATKKLNEVLNVKYSILMSNGTVATHCLLKSLKFKYPKINKIYVPNNVYVAVWNSVLNEYNLESIQVLPIDLETWNIPENGEFLMTLEHNSALLVVHNIGNIINVPFIKRIRPDIVILEDNCEGIFGKYEGINSGCCNDTLCSSVSFYGNKTVTTGEGGAFLTNDIDVYNYIKRVYSQGMSEQRYIHNIHAYNYRMTNIQAAFLFDQLNDIENILKRKQIVFDRYLHLFQKLHKDGKITFQKIRDNTNRANWMFALRILNNKKSIEETYDFFNENGIEIRPFFYSFNKHYHLKELETHKIFNYTDCDILNREIIMIPSSPMITEENQVKVVKCIENFINTIL